MADPVSAAGIALAVASLSFQVFNGCIQGYKLISDAVGMPESYRTHKLRLDIERDRLISWAVVAGLIGDDDHRPTLPTSPRMNPRVFLDILLEVQILLEQFTKVSLGIDQLQAVKAAHSDRALKRMKLLGRSAFDESDPVRSRASAPGVRALLNRRWHDVSEGSSSLYKRLQWATVQHDQFEALLKRLTDLNDAMHEFMDEKQSSELRRLAEQNLMGTLQLRASMEELSQLVKALKLQLPTAPSQLGSGAIPPQSSSFRDWKRSEQREFVELASFKQVNLSLGHGSRERATRLDRHEISWTNEEGHRLSHENATRSEARLQKASGSAQQVWIEWKGYPASGIREDELDPKALERVQHLVLLLQNEKPDLFRTPLCLGYLAEQEVRDDGGQQFGFVFEKPSGADPHRRPKSLLEMIKSQPRPSLTGRVKLAKELAACLMYLHSVNWLHKGFRSDNVIFFSDHSLDSPYLCGFDYARPAQRADLTEKPPENPIYDVYRHPQAMGDPREGAAGERSGFRKSYDIYSLGIVMLEIASWRTIESIVDIADLHRAKPSVTRGIRHRLLEEKEFLAQVEADAGTVYRDVVHVCLEGGSALGINPGASETSEAEAVSLQIHFHECIVHPLNGLRI